MTDRQPPRDGRATAGATAVASPVATAAGARVPAARAVVLEEPRHILEKIVWEKDREIESARQRMPLVQLKAQVADRPSPLDFLVALRQPPVAPPSTNRPTFWPRTARRDSTNTAKSSPSRLLWPGARSQGTGPKAARTRLPNLSASTSAQPADASWRGSNSDPFPKHADRAPAAWLCLE